MLVIAEPELEISAEELHSLVVDCAALLLNVGLAYVEREGVGMEMEMGYELIYYYSGYP